MSWVEPWRLCGRSCDCCCSGCDGGGGAGLDGSNVGGGGGGTAAVVAGGGGGCCGVGDSGDWEFATAQPRLVRTMFEKEVKKVNDIER